MKYSILIISAIMLLTCKESPNYNPFDTQLNVSVKEIAQNGCDTVSAGCGYFNLVNRGTHSSMHYQVYWEDFNTVIAKGFTYIEDTFKIEYEQRSEILFDSIKSLRINEKRLNEVIKEYDYAFLDYLNNDVRIIQNDRIDTLILRHSTSYIEDNLAIKYLSYFK